MYLVYEGWGEFVGFGCLEYGRRGEWDWDWYEEFVE